jgi:hypothetical protein
MTVDGPVDRPVVASWHFLGSDRFRLRIAGMRVHLLDTNVFDHLWFLCWLVAAFAVLARLELLPAGRHRLWFLPLSADATDWVYLAHVPLVLVAQLAVHEWPLAGGPRCRGCAAAPGIFWGQMPDRRDSPVA